MLKNRNDNKINLNGKWLVIMDTEDRLTKTRKVLTNHAWIYFQNMPHGLLSGDKKRKENNLYSVVTVVDKEFSTYSQIFLHTNIPLHSQIFRQISDLY